MDKLDVIIALSLAKKTVALSGVLDYTNFLKLHILEQHFGPAAVL